MERGLPALGSLGTRGAVLRVPQRVNCLQTHSLTGSRRRNYLSSNSDWFSMAQETLKT